VDIQDARSIVEAYIENNLIPPKGDRYIIVEDAVDEEEDGWYFPYQTEKYLKTLDINFSVVGNWPIFVSKDGSFVGALRPKMLR
jgi:hypothetical protein